MGCFGNNKRAEIVPSAGPAAGRLESDGKSGASLPRDGLHSAPTSQDRTDATKRRLGLHSAPHAAGDKGPSSEIGDFILEASDGSPPTKDAVDSYLEDIIGPKIVKSLRGAEWATRVEGIEALQRLVKQRAGEGIVATGGLDANGAQDEGERTELFRACVTVMTRALQDKVVPVYLPTLALLAEVFQPAFLAPMARSPLPKTAVPCFAHQLIFRAGSSNVRAREESQGALLRLARCDAVGHEAVFALALRPFNNKSAHACQGRLELLRALISEVNLLHACMPIGHPFTCLSGASDPVACSFRPAAPTHRCSLLCRHASSSAVWHGSRFGPADVRGSQLAASPVRVRL